MRIFQIGCFIPWSQMHIKWIIAGSKQDFMYQRISTSKRQGGYQALRRTCKLLSKIYWKFCWHCQTNDKTHGKTCWIWMEGGTRNDIPDIEEEIDFTPHSEISRFSKEFTVTIDASQFVVAFLVKISMDKIYLLRSYPAHLKRENWTNPQLRRSCLRFISQ